MTAWLDPAGVAARLSVKPRRLPALVKGGRLPRPSYHLGPRSPRWNADAIDSLMTGRQARDDVSQAVERQLNANRARRTKDPRGRNG